MRLTKWFNEFYGFPVRLNHLLRCISPYLEDVEKVLDLGASSGRLAKELSRIRPHAHFSCLDVYVPEKTFIPVQRYDGRQIPFPDSFFDCVMIVDVLHHDEDPEAILREAKRVSKKYILIKDHYWETRADFLLLCYADYIGNKPYGIPLPYNFLKLPDWNNLIGKTQLTVSKSEQFRYTPIDICKHVIFLLEKQKPNS